MQADPRTAQRERFDSDFLLRDLLRQVSRSFYLTLRVLPAAVRRQIGLAYLLARATDTIADTGAVSVLERLSALRILRQRILADRPEPFQVPDLQAHQSSPAERILLKRINDALRLLFTLPAHDLQLIQQVLKTITNGQELDLIRFGDASAENVLALESDAELDRYTFLVAGCVGEFWTRMCVTHLRPKPRAGLEPLIEKGIRFGKGLQLVNILRDIPADLRNGRCYLPWPALQLVGLRPGDLRDPKNEKRLRPVYDDWLAQAEAHLAAGWNYVLDVPRSWIRVRLACAWPVLIGMQTLDRLKIEPVLNPDNRIKISRREIKRILRLSILYYPFTNSWRNLPQRVRS